MTLKFFSRLLLLGVCALPFYGAALPCVTATLHSYDASGFSCSEDAGALIFSDFQFVESGTAVPLTDSSVDVTPLVDGFEFDAPFSAPSGTTLDVLIKYQVTLLSGSFTGDLLSMGGFAVSGNGSIDVAESVCIGAPFDAHGVCPGTVSSLNVFDNSGGIKASDSVTFSTAPITLGIVKDISILGGTGLSSANLSLVDNATPFSVEAPVSETSTLFLIVGGICLGLLGRRKLRQA